MATVNDCMVVVDDQNLYIASDIKPAHLELIFVDKDTYKLVVSCVSGLNFNEQLAEKDKNGNCPFWENDKFDSVVNAICILAPKFDRVKVSNALSMYIACQK